MGCVCVVVLKWGLLLDGRWSVVGCLLVNNWPNILIVWIDCWQRRFESAAVGVRPWRWVSSSKQPLCLGAAGSISDLDGTAAMVDAIDGRYSSL